MFEKFKGISGIYKITFPNGKSYIGLSTNIQQRMITHRYQKDKLPVHQAIQKYGLKDEYIEILEEITDKKLLSEREIYWISFYQTYTNGYNLTLGGEGSSPGIANGSSLLTQEKLEEIIQDLIKNEVYIKDLSKKYNLSPEAISNINTGKHYYNPNLVYPLRPSTRFNSESMKKITGVNKSNAKFNEETLNAVIQELQKSEKSLKDIAEIFNCSVITISHINNGKHYYNPNLDYPIRKKKITTTKLNEEQLQEIFKLLKETNLSYKNISEIFNISLSTVGRINIGKLHRQENLKYPIRQKPVSTISESGE